MQLFRFYFFFNISVLDKEPQIVLMAQLQLIFHFSFLEVDVKPSKYENELTEFLL